MSTTTSVPTAWAICWAAESLHTTQAAPAIRPTIWAMVVCPARSITRGPQWEAICEHISASAGVPTIATGARPESLAATERQCRTG
jgi:hypothetical protein